MVDAVAAPHVIDNASIAGSVAMKSEETSVKNIGI